jgi:hypothetical protein
MMRQLGFFFLATLSLSNLACGNSPLFNHENAVETSPRWAPAHGSCPLGFKNSALCASFDWQTGPAVSAKSTATLRFWDPSSATVNGPYRDVDGEVAVELWMPSMNLGSAPVVVTPQGGGTYAVDNIYFIMHGDWEVRVQIKRGGQLVDKTSFALDL